MIFLNKSPRPPPVRTSMNKSPKVGFARFNFVMRNLDKWYLLTYAIKNMVITNRIKVPTNPPRT